MTKNELRTESYVQEEEKIHAIMFKEQMFGFHGTGKKSVGRDHFRSLNSP